jgi:type I restriction enzyme S subunit
VFARFVAYALATPLISQSIVGDIQYGVTKASLSLTQVRTLPVPFPPLEEQRRIVHLIDDALTTLVAAEVRVTREQERTTELERATLAKAFRGELVPQDPNDESASELLKRIRAEREAVESKPARGRKRAAG